MNNYAMILFIICLILSSCQTKHETKVDAILTERAKEERLIIDNSSPAIEGISLVTTENFVLDTILLKEFWKTFKNDLQQGNKDNIIKTLRFPIHAHDIVTFQFAHDCDTMAFAKSEKELSGLDITKENIDLYFDFVFGDELKEVVYQTSCDELLRKGFFNYNKSIFIFQFFPRDYKIQVNCYNDHQLTMYITQRENSFKIKINAL